MSEEQQEQTTEITIETLTAQLEEKNTAFDVLSNDFDSMKSKTNELLDETKKAKNAKRDAEALAAKESEDKARKNGDYEQLLKSSEEQRSALEKQLKELNGNVSQEKTNNAAMKIAAELADGANAEILAEFVARRLKHTADGLKVLDSSGDLTVSSLADLKSEFATNEKYKSLVRGNQATGGGATGSGSGAPNTKQMTKAQWNGLNPAGKMEVVKWAKENGKSIERDILTD